MGPKCLRALLKSIHEFLSRSVKMNKKAFGMGLRVPRGKYCNVSLVESSSF